MSLSSNAFFNSLNSVFGYNLRTTVNQAVSQFDDEDAFKRHLKSNNVDIEKDLTEENVIVILDKWPEFFNDVNVELNDGDERYVLKPNLQLDNSTYEVTFNFGKNF